MRFAAVTLVSILVAIGAASPDEVDPDVKSMKAPVREWTIHALSRKCNEDDTCCHWSFWINANNSTKPTYCAYDVLGVDHKPGSESPGTGADCGDYRVTSGWSGQFGPEKGFTTLSVVDTKKKLIAWPAHTDKQLWHGEIVKPDQSYPVQSLSLR